MKTQWNIQNDGETPFNPLKEFDRLIGEQCKEAKNWRKIALVSMSAFFFSLIICLYAVNLPKTVPLVVTVSDWGEAKYVGNISKYSYQGINVPDIAIQYQLRKFITNYLSIPADSNVLKTNLKDCYSALTSNSASKLSKLLRENSPFNYFGEQIHTVSVESVLALSQNSYQIDFILKKVRNNGGLIEEKRMRSLCTTSLLEPSKEDQILNPLGIYITNFDVTEISNIGEKK